MRDERGAATVWTAAALVLLAAATLLATGQVGAVALRHRAQTAADLAALAAAGRIGLAPSDGPTGAACVAAGRTAAANGARLTACVPRLAADGRTGDVAVTVAVDGAVAGIPLHAEARARGARRPAITAVRAPAGVPGTAGASVRRGVRGPSRCTWRGPVAAFVLRRACGCGGGRSPTTTTRPLGRHLLGGRPVDLTLNTARVQDRAVLEVGGEVDMYSSPTLRERIAELLDSGERVLVVDLSGTSFLDSTGLGALVAGLNHAKQVGGEMPIVCSSDRILKLFRITGLDGVFSIHPSVDAAVGAHSA